MNAEWEYECGKRHALQDLSASRMRFHCGKMAQGNDGYEREVGTVIKGLSLSSNECKRAMDYNATHRPLKQYHTLPEIATSRKKERMSLSEMSGPYAKGYREVLEEYKRQKAVKSPKVRVPEGYQLISLADISF